jgi:cytosine/adenosine deaminase-related metal-dependent hydrolase
MKDSFSRPDFLRAGALGTAGTAALLGSGAPALAANDAAPNRLVLKGGHVLTLDRAVGDFPKADVLIEGGKIVDIKPNLNVAGAAVIDAANTIVMPGFIDTHRHMWEGLMRGLFPDLSLDGYFKYVFYGIGPSFRPEDVYAANLMSALAAVNAGITTILDFSHIQNTPQHADAAIQGLRESGMRAVFGYGYPTNGSPQWWTDKKESKYPEDIFRIQKQYFSTADQLLTLCLAAQGPGTCPDDVTLNNWKVARQAGVRISVHAGSGKKRGLYEPFAKVPGFFGGDTTYIHCNAFSDAEWKLLAASGGTVSLSPGSEMPMGHGLTVTQAALDHGIRPSLSVDVETTEPCDFFTTIRLTLYLQRLMINLRTLDGEKNAPKWVTARDVLEFATIEGARACGLDRKTGTLTPGKDADVIVLRTDRINVMPLNDPVGAVAELMDTSNVDTVLVRGRILKRNGQLVGVDVNRIGRMVASARDYVLRAADQRTGGLKT